MRWAPPPGWDERAAIVHRLDRAARNLNPLLIVVVIVLAIVNFSCYTALEIARLHPPGPGSNPVAASPGALTRDAVSHLPPS